MNTILVGKDCEGQSIQIGDNVSADNGAIQGNIKAVRDNGTVDISYFRSPNGQVTDSFYIKERTVTKMTEEISLIASGYDWVCPNCNEDNTIIHLEEIVTCKYCKNSYKTDDCPHHATG